MKNFVNEERLITKENKEILEKSVKSLNEAIVKLMVARQALGEVSMGICNHDINGKYQDTYTLWEDIQKVEKWLTEIYGHENGCLKILHEDWNKKNLMQ